jgi:hypothetical protein
MMPMLFRGVGALLGSLVGDRVVGTGLRVGDKVGALVLIGNVGSLVGDFVGFVVGVPVVGFEVGMNVGVVGAEVVGCFVSKVGEADVEGIVGFDVGLMVGLRVGDDVGDNVGMVGERVAEPWTHPHTTLLLVKQGAIPFARVLADAVLDPMPYEP